MNIIYIVVLVLGTLAQIGIYWALVKISHNITELVRVMKIKNGNEKRITR